MKLRVIKYDPFYVVTFKATTSAIDVGEMVQYSSGYIIPVAAVTDDATFVGISLGEALATVDSGKEIAVAMRCVCEATLTSATYVFGAGLKWASATSLVADADANTIAWFYDSLLSGGTLTLGKVLFDVPKLGENANKQFDTVSA